MEGVIEGDTDAPQPMGDDSIEVTEEKADEAMNKRGEAMAAMNEGNLEEAIKLFTEAIEMNPHLAMLFAKRARYVCGASLSMGIAELILAVILVTSIFVNQFLSLYKKCGSLVKFDSCELRRK